MPRPPPRHVANLGTTRSNGRPSSGLVKMNCCIVVTYICATNCYTGENDEQLVK